MPTVPDDGARCDPADEVWSTAVSVGTDGLAMVSADCGASVQVTVSASATYGGVSGLADLRVGVSVSVNVEGELQSAGTLSAMSMTELGAGA